MVKLSEYLVQARNQQMRNCLFITRNTKLNLFAAVRTQANAYKYDLQTILCTVFPLGFPYTTPGNFCFCSDYKNKRRSEHRNFHEIKVDLCCSTDTHIHNTYVLQQLNIYLKLIDNLTSPINPKRPTNSVTQKAAPPQFVLPLFVR